MSIIVTNTLIWKVVLNIFRGNKIYSKGLLLINYYDVEVLL